MKALAVIFALLPSLAWAADLTIVDARRNIPLSDDEPAYKDFYINAGEGSGLKKNLVVTAVRKLTVRDAAGSQAFGDMEIPVGQLRVIAVFGRVAVAREYKLLSRDENPMLEQIGLMIGDRIELKGAFVDNKIVPARRVSEAAPETSRETASVAPASVAAPVGPAASPATGTAVTETAPTGDRSAAPAPAAASPPAVTPTESAKPEPTTAKSESPTPAGDQASPAVATH